MLPFKIWILETFPEGRQIYIHTPTELPRMRSRSRKTPLYWDQCRRIINVSVPNNQLLAVVANETEIMGPFYICYVNWTLSHIESPLWQQSSPPFFASPPRRKSTSRKHPPLKRPQVLLPRTKLVIFQVTYQQVW
ncbi:unnamed protein product [Lactuca virosa]|uniref:Uncharacterized protein n=1 Tax=Lactuca virosa TaxID=75947 RepID=A0AAU9PT24_9ASTR|nr:unnamed protein product [Lactuca virosa]